MKRLSLLLCLVTVLYACAPKNAEEAFINDLLSRMTLEEKIGQLNQLDPSYDTEAKEALIREGKVGSVLNCVGAAEANRLQRMAVEETRLGIPLVIARDVIHGFRTIYPIPLGQGATWNPDLVEKAAALTADEAVSAGIRWAFSPMVDVARDPRWGRVAEGYGEDTYLTSTMAAAVVRGYQSHALAACVKHFAGYSASEGGRDYNSTWIPEVQLRDVYLPPFKAAVDAGAMSLMCSFNAINGLPSSANQHLNIDILRNEWHADALLVSDWGSGADLIPHGLCADRKEAALRCINARMEMDMQGNIYHDYLAELVREKKVDVKKIDDCVRSVLRMKYRLGLFNNPYVAEDEPVAYTDEALALATEAVEQSTVLLKNNGILPLNIHPFTHSSIHPFTILVTGPLADQKKEQLGTWVFDAEPEHSVTPLEALKLQITNYQSQIIYEPGLAYSRDKSHTGFAKAVAAARQSDLILFFAGEEAILSGEARCRAELSLPGAQTELLSALKATGKPIVLIVMAGRPLTIGKETEMADAVLYAFHGGTMTGPGLANVITGKAVPSGRLPMTFPKMVGQIPFYYNRLNSGRPCADDAVLMDDIPAGAPQFSIGASSYWLESTVEPLFPFGFGLSYTTFSYSEPQITHSSIHPFTHSSIHPFTHSSIRVSCDITNTGNCDSYETPQLYIRQLSGELARPVCELKGFQKIFIPAGETRTVSFTLTPEQLGYWHESYEISNLQSSISNLQFSTDTASFRLWIAPDSRCLTTPVEISLK